VIICLEQGAHCLHMVQLMPLHPKTSSSPVEFKSRLVLPFWYWLSQVILEKRPLNGQLGSYFSARKVVPCVRINGVNKHSLQPSPRLREHALQLGGDVEQHWLMSKYDVIHKTGSI